ncbi:MAG: UDP-glucose 4-epimerase GalE [Nitrospinota bacterium]
MRTLVTGGAGYIGSHTVRELSRAKESPVVFDSLITGHRESVPGATFVLGDLSDKALLEQVMVSQSIEAIIHFAAFAYVGESVKDPCKYYLNNVKNTLNLLEVALKLNVRYFVFSSSCATYGEPDQTPITEEHPQNPINPYGTSKFMVEKILSDYSRAYDFNYVSLRYFNAAGADPSGEIGEDHTPETHLLPLTIKAALDLDKGISGQPDSPGLHVFGRDYPTRDGTCIRDYIHVNDLATAHTLALDYLSCGNSSNVFNLGNEKGASVLEVINAVQTVTGLKVPFRYSGKREGDPAILVSSSKKVRAELGWKPEKGELEEIVQTAWNWHKKNPEGFKDKKASTGTSSLPAGHGA